MCKGKTSDKSFPDTQLTGLGGNTQRLSSNSRDTLPILMFGAEMITEMHKHEYKGVIEDCRVEDLLVWLKLNVVGVEHLLDTATPSDSHSKIFDRVKSELVDIGNYAMMIHRIITTQEATQNESS